MTFFKTDTDQGEIKALNAKIEPVIINREEFNSKLLIRNDGYYIEANNLKV